MNTSLRFNSLALALCCAAALSSCSGSQHGGSASKDEERSVVQKEQDLVYRDAANLSRAVRADIAPGDTDAQKQDKKAARNLDLPTDGALPSSLLEDLGVTLGEGNAAYVLAYESRTAFTVCVDRDGEGPSVTHENTRKRDMAIPDPSACE